MHAITKWVYCIMGYNWCWLALLYAIPEIRWNTEEMHMRSVSGMLHLFKPAGIIGFGALYATVFMVFVVNSMNNQRMLVLAVVMLLACMGVLGFDVVEYKTLHCFSLVVLLVALVAYANLQTQHVLALNCSTVLFLYLIVANARENHRYETIQVVVELLWAVAATSYVLQLTHAMENVTCAY